MKLLTYLFTLFFVFNAIAVAPYGIKGQAQSGTLYSNVHQFPNSQVTNTGGINALVETGNKQILTNPSFEHATANTAWSLTAGTFVNDNTPIDGLRNAQLTLSAQSLFFSQDSTLYASQFADGVQGLASIRVRTSITSTPIYVCSRQAGVTGSIGSGCVQVTANGKWGLYKVPFILGATSNGIAITSNAVSITGDIELDDAFVGAVDLAATVDQSRIAGESYFAGTTSCNWARTSTSVGAFTATAACPGPTVVDGSMGLWQTTDSDLPRQTINNLPAGKYKATFIVKAGMTANATMGFAINDGTTTCEPHAGVDILTGYIGQAVSCTFIYTSSGNRVFELYAGSASSTVNILNSQTAPRVSTKFILEYYGSGSVYSSTNADTDWASCNFSTLAWQGLGTVTTTTKCKRQGSDLLMRGRVTVGTVTASVAQIPLPLWNGVQLTSANSSKISDFGKFGDIIRNTAVLNNVKDYILLGQPSLSYLNIGYREYAITTSPFATITGNNLFSNNDVIDLDARIPIEGWDNSNIIIGQFNGLESCTDTYQCTDMFSAYVDPSGVVSQENIDWINGNCSVSTSTFSCTYKNGLAGNGINLTGNMNCTLGAQNASWASTNQITSGTTTGFSVYSTRNDSSIPTSTASGFFVHCQKQGVDYIGKTAKAVASDQNLRTPGITKSIIFSAVFAGSTEASTCATTPCTLYNNRGGIITGVTRTSTGIYSISTTGLSGNAPTCTYSTKNFSGSASTSCYSASVRSLTTIPLNCLAGGTAIDAAIEIVCHGETP